MMAWMGYVFPALVLFVLVCRFAFPAKRTENGVRLYDGLPEPLRKFLSYVTNSEVDYSTSR